MVIIFHMTHTNCKPKVFEFFVIFPVIKKKRVWNKTHTG